MNRLLAKEGMALAEGAGDGVPAISVAKMQLLGGLGPDFLSLYASLS